MIRTKIQECPRSRSEVKLPHQFPQNSKLNCPRQDLTFWCLSQQILRVFLLWANGWMFEGWHVSQSYRCEHHYLSRQKCYQAVLALLYEVACPVQIITDWRGIPNHMFLKRIKNGDSSPWCTLEEKGWGDVDKHVLLTFLWPMSQKSRCWLKS